MFIKKCMNRQVESCMAEDRVSQAIHIMRGMDCGTVPVVDANKHVIGMITDRDICLGLDAFDKRSSQAHVSDFMSRHVLACFENDEAHVALKMMGDNQIRRLPVLDSDGKLCGILSLNDLVLCAERQGKVLNSNISEDDIVSTMKKICAHEHRERVGGELETVS